jgi:subtilisin family serine protease
MRTTLLLLCILGFNHTLIRETQAQTQQKYWIYLAEKKAPVCQNDPRACALEPIDLFMLQEIKAMGFQVHTESRWLNAVSVHGSEQAFLKLQAHPGVRAIEPVQYYRKPTLQTFTQPAFIEPAQALFSMTQPHNKSYGGSFEQIAFHNIDDVHEMGYNGKGIIVGIMDGGFDIQHPVFEHLRTSNRILAERDFVNGGNNTKVNVGNSSYHSHGTSVAGIIAGVKDSTLMGVAPAVSLVIARTEDDTQEAPVEEDNWIKAIEWMQTLGVKVVNTSLGYSIFTSQPAASYTYQQMNGRTSAIAKAALKAATIFNMVIVVSAGNEGTTSWKYITTPADADSILSVGSLNNLGQRVSSSSIGPTADGRIKPDVMARGACVYSSTSSAGHGYASCLNGTSFASPMVAGMMALAMQAKPGMPSYFYVQKAKQASSQFNKPDNMNGYGTLDALKLIQLVLTTTSINEEDPQRSGDDFVISNYPNPFNPSTTIEIQKPDGWEITSVSIYDLLGRQVHHFAAPSSGGRFYWNHQDQQQPALSSGIYLVKAHFSRGLESVSRVHRISLIK